MTRATRFSARTGPAERSGASSTQPAATATKTRPNIAKASPSQPALTRLVARSDPEVQSEPPYGAAAESESSPLPWTTETTGSLPRRQSTDGAVRYTGSRKISVRATKEG